MALAGRRDPNLGSESADQKKRITYADLIIPMLSFVILLLLTLFVYIPSISDSVELRGEIDSVKEQQERTSQVLSSLNPLVQDKLKVEQDLVVMKSVIPTSLDVADFTFYVDKLATESRLQFREVTSGDVDLGGFQGTDTVLAANVFGVSGPIVYEGSFDDVVEFLDRLQSESPFMVETSGVRVSEVPADILVEGSGQVINSTVWRVELNVTGYYIKDSVTPFNPQTNLVSFTSYRIYPEVLAVFQNKSDKLNGVDQGDEGIEPSQVVEEGSDEPLPSQ